MTGWRGPAAGRGSPSGTHLLARDQSGNSIYPSLPRSWIHRAWHLLLSVTHPHLRDFGTCPLPHLILPYRLRFFRLLLIVTFGGGRGGSPLRSTCPGADPPEVGRPGLKRSRALPRCVVARPPTLCRESGSRRPGRRIADLPKRSLSVREAQRWSAQTGVRQNRAGQGRIPGLHPLPSAAAAAAAARRRWGRSCNSGSRSGPVGLTPSLLCSARPARLRATTGSAPLPAPEPSSLGCSPPHATPARQGPFLLSFPLPAPARCSSPDPGPPAKPLSQCELPLLHIHPLSSHHHSELCGLGRLCQCGFENGNKCPTLGVDCGAGAVPVGWQR